MKEVKGLYRRSKVMGCFIEQVYAQLSIAVGSVTLH